VKDINDITDTFKKAFHVATTGRPGPVVIDIPKNITDPAIKVAYHYPAKVSMRAYKPASKGDSQQIKAALTLLLSAKKPVIYTGGGIILGNAHQELTELAND
jgi:acetolactate synthase-1/2/3 large subunit